MKYTCEKFEHTRKAYGRTLLELGGEDEDIVVLDADLSSSTQTHMFGSKYPDRFFNAGIAEQNMMGMAAGLALSGKTVFASTFAMFGSGRAWEQIRNTIAYDRLNVKIVLTHAGITVGKDGASHQVLEDLALMRVIPNMVVQVPADPVETSLLVREAAAYDGPVYIRLTREKSPVLFEEDDIKSGVPYKMFDGDDVTIFSCGYMLAYALEAVALLKKEGISASLVNVNQIKPLDEKYVVKEAKKTGAVVTVEEHSIVGGLGSAISEVLAETYPTPLQRVGIRDRFGKSGATKDLFKMYNLMPEDIVGYAKKALASKDGVTSSPKPL